MNHYDNVVPTIPSFLRGNIPRNLNENLCTESLVETVPSNSDNSVQPINGIFFEVYAKDQGLTLQTLELDVSNNSKDSILPVSVYISNQPIIDIHSDSDAWTRVAQTQLATHSVEDGALIAAGQFASDSDILSWATNQRKSLYIRLDDSALEYTLDAFANSPGSEAVTGEFFDIDSGYAVEANDDEFPTSLRQAIAPIFAGRFHFERQSACDQVTLEEFNAEFAIIVDSDEVLTTTVRAKVDAKVVEKWNELLVSDDTLSSMVKEYQLALATPGSNTYTNSYNGNCPFAECYGMISAARFVHTPGINAGEIKNELYRYRNDIAKVMLDELTTENGIYLGLVPVQAGLETIMSGVSRSDVMDQVQADYFENRLVIAANRALTPGATEAFVFDVKNQLLFDSDSIRVQVLAKGAIAADKTRLAFENQLVTVLEDSLDSLVEDLKHYQLFPGEMAEEGRTSFFAGLSSLTIDAIDLDLVADDTSGSGTGSPSPTDGDGGGGDDPLFDMVYIIYAGVGIGALILLAVMCMCCRSWMLRSKNKTDVEDRKIRKLENDFYDDDEKTMERPNQSPDNPRMRRVPRNIVNVDQTEFEDEHSRTGSLTRGQSVRSVLSVERGDGTFDEDEAAYYENKRNDDHLRYSANYESDRGSTTSSKKKRSSKHRSRSEDADDNSSKRKHKSDRSTASSKSGSKSSHKKKHKKKEKKKKSSKSREDTDNVLA